jgi:hypothetical protein
VQQAKCRLFVIPARDKPGAIIIRRGPSAWYHLILWETRRKNRDLFTNGAWFRGRIYPEKCDLSPDGNLFVYFAFQGSRGGGRCGILPHRLWTWIARQRRYGTMDMASRTGGRWRAFSAALVA